jgi:hypothetical protein
MLLVVMLWTKEAYCVTCQVKPAARGNGSIFYQAFPEQHGRHQLAV